MHNKKYQILCYKKKKLMSKIIQDLYSSNKYKNIQYA
jgi:hypothetical protein